MTPKKGAVPPQKSIPKAAHTWDLFRYERKTRKDKEDGSKYHTNAQVRMRGEPDDDGNVAELFPVAEFSTASVLARWGDGRYFVHFFDKRGEKVGGWSFSVQAPPQEGHARAASRGDDDEPAAGPHKLPTTQLEWLLYQQAREERQERQRREEARDERDRMREENNERREQDREFLKAVLGSKGTAGAGDEHLSLAIERMALNQERGMLAFERRMRALLDEHGGDEPEPDDTDPPPKNLDQAAKRVGMRLLSELEKKAPDMLEDAIPKVIEFFKGAGFQPSAALEEEVEQVAQQRRSRVAPNGSARTRS